MNLFNTQEIVDPKVRKLFDSLVDLGNLVGHEIVEVENSEIPESVCLDCALYSIEFKKFVEKIYAKFIASNSNT